MVTTALLLILLFIAGLINLYFSVPSKKLYAWLQSLFVTSSAPLAVAAATTAPQVSIKAKGAGDDYSNYNKMIGKSNNKAADELSSVFATFDKNGDGFITKQELKESLKNIRIFVTEKEVEEMVVKVDSNGDGLIDFEEFKLLCQTMAGPDDEEERLDQKAGEAGERLPGDGEVDLKDAFDVFDRDNDGLISVEELGSVLSSLGLKEGKKMEDCKEMIRKVDMDGDGMVNFDEFKRMMRGGGGKLIPVF